VERSHVPSPRLRSAELELRENVPAPGGLTRRPSGARTLQLMLSEDADKKDPRTSEQRRMSASVPLHTSRPGQDRNKFGPTARQSASKAPRPLASSSRIMRRSWRGRGRGRSCRNTRRRCRTPPKCRPAPHRDSKRKTSRSSPALQPGTRPSSSAASAA